MTNAALSGRVVVLLATYNGAAYLDDQLRSVACQSIDAPIDILVSDDGSTDATPEKLATWTAAWPRGAFHVLKGPRKGFASNFASLISRPDILGNYFAFCDQDDVWDADKLERAILWLSGGNEPRVYAGRTRLIDPSGALIGLSPLFPRRPDFRNAIVQSIAGGNTMVLNSAARELLAETAKRTGFVSHDWWTYMIVTGAGGSLHYDPRPAISYRQHGKNAVGANTGWSARYDRLRRMAEGRFRVWNDINVAALYASADLLTLQAMKTLDSFESARHTPHTGNRLRHLYRSGIFRQTQQGQAGLYLACVLGRL